MYTYYMSCIRLLCHPITYINGIHVHQREVRLLKNTLLLMNRRKKKILTFCLSDLIYVFIKTFFLTEISHYTKKKIITIFILDQQDLLQFHFRYKYFLPKIEIFRKLKVKISLYHLPNLQNIIF